MDTKMHKPFNQILFLSHLQNMVIQTQTYRINTFQQMKSEQHCDAYLKNSALPFFQSVFAN